MPLHLCNLCHLRIVFSLNETLKRWRLALAGSSDRAAVSVIRVHLRTETEMPRTLMSTNREPKKALRLES
ncbi:hypothetical protein C27AD_06815 [Salinisphaera hydrothermalis C27AD]